MYAYYLDRGHTIDHLLSLNSIEKIFYAEAMEISLENRAEEYKAMMGGKR